MKRFTKEWVFLRLGMYFISNGAKRTQTKLANSRSDLIHVLFKSGLSGRS